MVKVLANGDIVPDDDPRVRSVSRSSGAAPSSAARPRQGFIQNDNTGIPGGHGANLSVFDAINQRLSALGIPTWRAGPYTVRPVVSLGFLLSLLLMGFSGLLFSGVLFFISKYSQHGWSDDRITRTEDSGTRSVPPPAAGGNWPGSGHRLGR